MPNCFSSTFICLHRVPVFRGKLEGGKGDGEGKEGAKKKCLWVNESKKTRLTKSPFCFHNSYCNISQMSHIFFFVSPPLCRLPVLFPLRSVIQLHHLDVLLKFIMDSWGSPHFSSSFTEYSQCYSNLPTTPSCIGNETPAPTPPHPREIAHLYTQPGDKHSSRAPQKMKKEKKNLKMRLGWKYLMQSRDKSSWCTHLRDWQNKRFYR